MSHAKTPSRDFSVPWYLNEVGNKLGSPARSLLEDYGNVPADKVEITIKKARDRAWQVQPYPCLGGFRFLDLALSQSPHYPAILQRLKTENATFLDLGCCLGQEIRKLVADGAPAERLYGTDLFPEFFECGYQLFGDKSTLKTKFIAADIFDTSSDLDAVDGKIDILFVGSLLHIFSYADQVTICKRMVTLLKPKAGSMAIGWEIGNVTAGEHVRTTTKSEKLWRHNADSFEKMWKEVGEQTGSKWKVEVEGLKQESDQDTRNNEGWAKWQDPQTLKLRYTAFRQ